MSDIFSAERVAIEIDQFLRGALPLEDWRLFLQDPWPDSKLEQIRQRCIDIPKKFPPKTASHWCNEEGVVELREVRRELNVRDSSKLLGAIIALVVAFLILMRGPAMKLRDISALQAYLLFALNVYVAGALIMSYFRNQ
jgi:hypothetical protein